MGLFICALWSPAGKGLTTWLSSEVSNCEFVTFPLVSWVWCGTWYQWESDKLTVDTTNESQEVSPFPAGDHKEYQYAKDNDRTEDYTYRMATSSVSLTECSKGTLSRHHVYCRGGCLFTCFKCMVRKRSKTLKAIKTRLRYELGNKMLETLLHILQHPFYKLWFTGVYINFFIVMQ